MTHPHVFRDAFLRGLAPAPRLTVSEWADQNRVLPPETSVPGQWRTSHAPYLREIMDCLSATSDVSTVVLCKGAQIGGSEVVNNWVGYCIAANPGAMLLVQPTIDIARLYVRLRIDPMIENSRVLSRLVREKKSRDSGNTTTDKVFPNGFLRIGGANAASGLASLPVRYLALDEVDRFPLDVEDEGDPVTLARARQMTFGAQAKTLIVSTPTIEGESRIQLEFEKTDQAYYHVPCPFCGTFQVLKWLGVKWERSDFQNPGRVAYQCSGCEKLIDEAHKGDMLAAGEWRSTAPSTDPRVRGFHVSALYAPPGGYTWTLAAKEFLQASKGNDANALKAFVNTKLGETWREVGDAPPWRVLFDRSRHGEYSIGTVPPGVVFLTAGVDIQGDRIECEIVGWGRDFVSWSIDYRVWTGNPEKRRDDVSEPSPWTELWALLRQTWAGEKGGTFSIRCMGVDSQFATQSVYAEARRQDGHRVIVLRGEEKHPLILGNPQRVDLNDRGKRSKRGMRQWKCGTNMAKGELYGFLRLETAVASDGGHQPGYCHFPSYPEEYFRQLTAEVVQSKIVKGYKRYEWVKTRERNEALDCRVYARAAAERVGISKWPPHRWKAEELAAGVEGPRAALQTSPAGAPAPVAAPRTESRLPAHPPRYTDRSTWRLR